MFLKIYVYNNGPRVFDEEKEVNLTQSSSCEIYFALPVGLAQEATNSILGLATAVINPAVNQAIFYTSL